MAKNKLAKLVSGTEASIPAPAAYKPTKEDEARQRRYRADDALRCLIRAEEIRRDKPLMRDVLQLAAEQRKELQTISAKRSGPR